MLIGTLAAIRRYPVKSLRADTLVSARVDVSGIPGDRAAALIVRGGHAREGKAYRGKEHDRLHVTADVPAARALAAEHGVTVEAVHGEHFFDDAPISLVVDRWLEGLSQHLGYAVQWERFRPNFFVSALPAFSQTEGDLAGAELEIGTVRLRVRCPISRCVVITYDPAGGASDPRVLEYVAQERDACLGTYCDVLQPGSVRVGDVLARL